MEYKIETCRKVKTAEKIMTDYAKDGWILDKFCTGDMGTMYVMVFKK